ncbi:unnamed protein product [Caenorhabditis bovis]|uniref:HORMA domain-containing protein n=1 Tax=Caenorhabditis bovis TaxID=2654633 RepID=A0A8S1EY83_9PELO|nr:unnamed protein product [Caenorhabditis bovis]
MAGSTSQPMLEKSKSLKLKPWEHTFPKEIDEKKNSKEFVYRFLALSAAMILDKRSSLHESTFKQRVIESIRVPTFDDTNPHGKRLKKKLEALRHTIENEYLQEFAIVIYRMPDEEDVVEVFSFKIAYNSDNITSVSLDSGIGTQETRNRLLEFQFKGLEQTKTNFTAMMKRLHKMLKNLNDLNNEEFDSSFRIAFTEKTPNDYVPEGFMESDKFYSISDPNIATIGMIGAGFQRVQLLMCSMLLKRGIDFNSTMTSLDESMMVPKPKQSIERAKQKKKIEEIDSTSAVKCFDCVGIDCMGSFCEGDYCMVSQYAPRWGSVRWGEPEIVKGCVSGKMISKDIRDHCEWAEDAEEPFTCFCNGKDLCNSPKMIRRFEKENVELVRCVCKGSHCRNDKTCLGEFCTYNINHRTKEVEQGCSNASVPLVERRAIGSCMAPPITGAMHHNVAKDAASLLAVEACVCGTDYCNSEKPAPSVPEKEKCAAYVEVNSMGTKTQSKNITCKGEYCFKTTVKSKIGALAGYTTYGCASFTGEDELPEELDPTGCAYFKSEKLEVKTCYMTKDKQAIGRALALKQVPESSAPAARKPGKGGRRKQQREDEMDDEEDDVEEEEEEEEPVKEKKPPKKTKNSGKEDKPEKSRESKEERKSQEVEEEDDEDEDEEEPKSKEEKAPIRATTVKSFIFEKPTQPPIPDDRNTTMITVFVLLILCILGSGIVIKFELHKKLKRSSYDTVAGG